MRRVWIGVCGTVHYAYTMRPMTSGFDAEVVTACGMKKSVWRTMRLPDQPGFGQPMCKRCVAWMKKHVAEVKVADVLMGDEERRIPDDA